MACGEPGMHESSESQPSRGEAGEGALEQRGEDVDGAALKRHSSGRHITNSISRLQTLSFKMTSSKGTSGYEQLDRLFSLVELTLKVKKKLINLRSNLCI